MAKSRERVVAENIAETPSVVPTYSRDFVTTLVAGALIGVVVAAAYYLLNTFVFSAVLCRNTVNAAADCTSAPVYSMTIALVISVFVGLLALVQARIYRPLLIVLATAVAFWGMQSLLGHMAWYWGLLLTAGLFAVAYLAFAWLARIRSFGIAVIVSVIVVVLVRLALNS